MPILSGKEILKPFIHRTAGYVKSLLSAEHVEMGDGSTLEEKVSTIEDGIGTLDNLFNIFSSQFEIIENIGGYAFRFQNGLQICVIKKSINTGTFSAWGNIYSSGYKSLGPMPTSFKTVIGGFVSVINTGLWCVYDSPTTTNFSGLYFLTASNGYENIDTDCIGIVIGFWK